MKTEIAEPRTGAAAADVPSDAALREALAARRDGAFELLVATYQDRLYTLAWRVTGHSQDAEEAVQEALIRAYRALTTVYTPERVQGLALRPWLYTVVLNAARNVRRARPRTASLETLLTDERSRGRGAADGSATVAAAEHLELATALEAALAGLSQRSRVAVVLRHVEGFSYEEVARIVGRPVGTVKSDVHRALRQLRRRLGPLLEADPRRG